MISQEQRIYLDTIRSKSLAGTATMEEFQEAIRIMRGDRMAAAVSAGEAAKTRAKAKKAIPDADSLLDDLMGG